MVKHAVQHQVDATVVCLGGQGLEQRQVTKVVVDDAKIGGVIFMIRRRFKDGVHVDDRHAQTLQVV